MNVKYYVYCYSFKDRIIFMEQSKHQITLRSNSDWIVSTDLLTHHYLILRKNIHVGRLNWIKQEL